MLWISLAFIQKMCMMIFDFIWSNSIANVNSIDGNIATWVAWTPFDAQYLVRNFSNTNSECFVTQLYNVISRWCALSVKKIALIAQHSIGKWNERYSICYSRKQVLIANGTSLHAHSFIGSHREDAFFVIQKQWMWIFIVMAEI